MKSFFSYNDDSLSFIHLRDEHINKKLFAMHTHQFAELYFFISGKGIYHIEGSNYELKCGDILLMRPNEFHYIDIDESVAYERIVINFNTNLFDSFDKNKTLVQPYFNRNSGKLNLYRFPDYKSKSYIHMLECINAESRDIRIQILAKLLFMLNEINEMFQNGNAISIDDNENIMTTILKYINTNLSNEITLDKIAEEFYISKPQLCRIFKSATGSTIGEYIRVKRLTYAKKWIEDGEKPTTIYINCGYRDYSSFYRAYVKEFGSSPSCQDYGKNNKQPQLS